MKLFSLILSLLVFSNCGPLAYHKVLKAKQAEKIDQVGGFKRVLPFHYDKGWIVVEVTIDGKPANLVFDSGASTFIDVGFAKTLNCKKIGTSRTKDARNKKKLSKVIQLDKILVSDIGFSNVVAEIADLGHLKKLACVDFSGILGANMMDKAVWQIDYQKQILVLTSSRDSLTQPDDKKSFWFHTTGQKTPKFNLSIDNQYIGEAIMDTGSAGGISLPEKHILPFKNANKFIVAQNTTGSLNSVGFDTMRTTIVPNLRIGRTFETSNSFVTFSENLPLILIGNAFWENYLVTIDWKRQEITLASNKKDTIVTYFTFGFSPRFKDNKLIIGSLTENSPATKAGLRFQDQILQINDRNFRNATHLDYCELLENESLNKLNELSILVKQGNQEIQRKLIKTDLFKDILNTAGGY